MAEDRYHWGMVIDLDLCTSCQACVVACQAENNVPAVGEEEVVRSRGMHWIRIERNWHIDGHHVQAEFLPNLCQHCGNAPCEPVCPMYATYHDTTNQINVQVYNRCAGIRYCGVNCPYKVRHFNWFDPFFPEPMNEQLNPDVTVRRRGIMEKCSFCVQRIRRARAKAKRDGLPLDTSKVVPACVQTCPTGALVFGDLHDEESPVARLSRSPRAYALLEDLGTEPSIRYLKRGETYVPYG